MEYNIVTFPDERLKVRSEEVAEINDDIKNLVKDMFRMMYLHRGVGLSAVQIGVNKRIFVMDIPKKGQMVMINPVIKDMSKETSTYVEGCLSLPEISAEVERPKIITLEYTDIKGKRQTLTTKGGMLSTCIQHEYDHLDGILFIDRLSPEERLEKIKEYRKINNK